MPCTRNDDQASPIVRDGSSSDVAEVLRIYTPYVLYGLATFEEEPPTIEEMGKRR